MLDFINGNKFSDIADFVIDFDHNDLNTNLYKQNCIIFCKTDFLDFLFGFIKFSKRKYILISHLSDYPIDEYRFKKAPSSIVKWYAQNAIYDNERLISIPIGLENHVGKSKGKFTDHDWFVNNVYYLQKINKDDSIYCNWNPNTNREIRQPIIEKLRKNCLNLQIEHNLSFQEYCKNMARHKFVICPPGNGLDTHRLWESLYLGCYPITLNNRIYKDFMLPILQINDWSEVTQELLNIHYIKYKDEISFDELLMKYWINKIKNDFNSLCVIK